MKIPFDGTAFRWRGIDPREYKLAAGRQRGMGWNAVTRFTLGRPPEVPSRFELRYFEIAPRGYSSLEKHAHAHLIVAVRGKGKALVGQEVFDVAPFDLVFVPPATPHRWIGDESEPFGFVCPVDAERDKPQPLTDEEWETLRNNPVTAPYVF
jgi:quercetin dioxygenase-like cupin family protein